MSRAFAVTRITHSCHLLEIGGLTVLTDPWFSEKPAYHPGEAVALRVSERPRLDPILISHAHYDHCDLNALEHYPDRSVPIIANAAVERTARNHGFTDVTSLRPWESV